MKKILFIFMLFFAVGIVKAEQFTIEEYIDGEHLKMVSDEKTKTLTMQIIRDSNGRFVYCLEPFELVDEELTEYDIYTKDLSGYKNLTEEQKRKVSLIAYYGYGYSGRATKVWYAATQMLIWKTVDPESEFYFTDTLGGEKISKHVGRMNDILEDVEYHDVRPGFVKDYEVNYEEDLVITNFDYRFEITTDDYDYIYDIPTNTITVKNVTTNGVFTFEKNLKDYLRDVTIFSSEDGQDLIRPGNVINTIYTINVNVTKGSITLNISDDESSVYTKESTLFNTCYEIYKEDEVIDKVCVKKNGFIYKTSTLPYGIYKVKQVSVGVGYETDNNEYEVIIDGSSNSTVVLKNNLIKNKIELNKYYCYNDECLSEESAVFKVYDNKGAFVGSITTDVNGYGYIDVGYGTYTIEQYYGLDNYTFVDSFRVSVANSSDRYFTELFNYYIDEETGEYGNDDNEDTQDNVPIVPEIPDKEDEDEVDIKLDISNDKDDEVVEVPLPPKEEIKEEIKDEIELDKEQDKVNDIPIIEEVTDFEDNIVEEYQGFEEIIEEENAVLPPATGTKLAEFIKILYNVIMIIICSCKLKRFCYNN